MMLPEQIAREWPPTGRDRRSREAGGAGLDVIRLGPRRPARDGPHFLPPYPGGNRPEGQRGRRYLPKPVPRPGYTEAERWAARGWRMSDESTAVLQGYLARAMGGDAAARRRLLEVTRDRLMRHARRHLHGSHARLKPF